MTKRRPSFLTREETPTPPKKQRKLTKNQAAITAAVYSAILPCLDLIDPLMEFTRACSPVKINTAKSRFADERAQEVRRVVEEPRERFANPPTPKSEKVVFNEHDEAEIVESEDELICEETEAEKKEDKEVKLVKPRKMNKLNVILSQPGDDFVEVYKGPFKPSETVPASEDEEQVERGAENEGKKKKKGKSAKKPKKRQTEAERLGGPVQDAPKSRRSSRVKTHGLEVLNRAEDSADEAGLENQDVIDEDVSEEFWWRCQHTDADTDCWCTTWESLRRPALWKGGRWI